MEDAGGVLQTQFYIAAVSGGGEEGAGGSLVARLFSQSIPETEDDSAPIYT